MRPAHVLAHLLTLCATASALAAQRPFNLEDHFAVKRVADPRVSPDGQWICHQVGTVDQEKNKVVNHLWIVAAKGGEPRQLTNHDKGERGGRWSPDGQWIAFISTRAGSPQVWKVKVDNGAAAGEPVQVTNLSTGADNVIWSPTGKDLAFTSDVWPDIEGDDKQKARADEMEKSPVKARVIDDLLYRHWNEWRDGKHTHVFVTAVEGGVARDATPGDFDCPPFSLGGPDAFAFSPDGSKLAYTRGPERKVESWSTNADLFVVDLKTGARQNLTATNKGWDGSPTWSPDGQWIAYRSQEKDGCESDRFRLRLIGAQGGEPKALFTRVDRSVDDLLFMPDGKRILVTVESEGNYSSGYAPVEGGPAAVFCAGEGVSSLSVSANGQVVVGTVASLVRPPEVCRAFDEGKKAKSSYHKLTSHNDALFSGIAMPSVESIWFDGALGAKVQAFVLKPPGFEAGRKYPLIMFIHGGPQGAWHDAWSYRWNPAIYAAQGYVVVCPNPHGSTGFGQAFCDQISGDWGGACYEDVMKCADHMIATGYVDKDRMGAAGGSFGGYMVNWILGHTDRFKALVSHAGVYNLESMYGVTEELWFAEWEFKGQAWNSELFEKWSPHRLAGKFKTPTLVVHGELDFRVPIGEGLQLFTALRRQGVDSKLLYFPDEGHWVQKPRNSRLWNETVSAWFARYLKR